VATKQPRMTTLRPFALAFTLMLSCLAQAAVTPRAEVDGLLSKLEASGCQFYRNGDWHTSAEAKVHLVRKLDYLENKGTLKSAEQFIELAATKSSVTGQAYQVKCASSAAVPSATWLTQQLQSLRGATATR
jgi:hypothetical protein